MRSQALARRELLRVEAPDLDDWTPPAEDRWRLDATVVGPREVYVHDWCDPEKWDRWLYERYALFAAQMESVLGLWIAAGAWGTIVCSNAAPHHPMWNDVALQQEVNALFRTA